MDWSDGMTPMKVYRKGRKWRVAGMVPDRKDVDRHSQRRRRGVVKEDFDSFTRGLSAICDGERVYYYRLERKIFGKNAKVPKVKLAMTQALNLSEEPLMPWPDKFPEHISHTNVWQPSHDRAMLLEPKPDNGPPGTIRLRVRDTSSSEPEHPDLYKLWLDPAAGYIAVRSETSGSVERTIEAVRSSMRWRWRIQHVPGGFWYPTQVRRKTSNLDSEQVWKYFLDFEKPIPDDLFLPLK